MLAGLPLVVFVLPALLGHPVLPGDDLTQNYPLRVLAGSQWRQGHLPLFNPYIWSGAPLLGAWNAGAAYPLTFLFAVLPGVAAWTVNMAVTWWTAGLGTFAFLRASRLSPVASLLGALSFAFAGAMAAHVSHFGLVAGVSWVPVALLACLRLSQRPGFRARLGWIAVLAGAVALVILAGEPRAIDDAMIIMAGYAGWRAWRAWRDGHWRGASAYLAVVLAGLALGAAIGAIQWVPGIEAVHTSQRLAHSAAFFDSGSLARKWLLLLLVPDLLGGSGSFGQPAFFASYNLTEVTGYVGLMPLVAACALLARLRRRPRLPEWAIWHLVALAGLLLALGGNTPLGHVLVHLPFFGSQRLQSRNLMIADFALAVLLAYWADQWLGEPRARPRKGVPAGGAGRPARLAGAVPGVAVMGVVAAALIWGAGMLRWLGLSPGAAGQAGPLRPWLVPALVLGGLATALVWWGPRLGPGPRLRVLAWFVGADITLFTLLAVVAVAPGTPGTPGATGATGPAHPAAPPAPAAVGTASSAVVPVRDLTHGGRFAVYDPGLLASGELTALGVPDGNVTSQTPSIQGYSAILDATYAAATGSHQAMGEGQNVLDPRAIDNGTLDQLGTTVLLTPAAYLITPAGRTPAGTPGDAGLRTVVPHQSATWYFASALPVTSVAIPVSSAAGAHGDGIRVGLVRASGSVDWIAAAPGPGGRLSASLAAPRPAVAIRVTAGTDKAVLGPPVVGTAGGARYRADGQLQDALIPPRWAFTGFDGAFAVFRNTMARPALTLRAAARGTVVTARGTMAGARGTVAGAFVRAVTGPGFAPASAYVSSAHGVTVIRAVADIPGWAATWQPAGGHTVRMLPVDRSGLVQAVTVPAGRGTVTWRYVAPGARLGLGISLVALAVLAGLSVAAALPQRRRGRAGWAQQAQPDSDPEAPRGLASPAGLS